MFLVVEVYLVEQKHTFVVILEAAVLIDNCNDDDAGGGGVDSNDGDHSIDGEGFSCC